MNFADTPRRPSPPTARMIIGIVIIAVGLLLSAQNFGYFTGINIFDFWPLVLIAVGIRKIVHPVRSSSRTWGSILVAVGAFILLHNLGIDFIRFRTFWPILLVSVGLSLVWRSFFPKADETVPESGEALSPSGASSDRLSEWAAFGGGERRIVTDDFQGGEVTVVFGGLDIDLRNSSIQRDQVVIDVFAMFGGVELKVPPEWNVRVEGFPVFGGFDDKTIHPTGEQAAVARRLVVRGAVAFGGIDVHN